MRLFSFRLSGNCYKVRLLLAHLGIPYDAVEVDILAAGGRSPELTGRHPLGGHVPMLELDDGTCIAESGAILCYLAEGTAMLPVEPRARAAVMQWLFFEQNRIEPNIATSRYWITVRAEPAARAAVLPLWKERGDSALDVLERRLGTAPFLTGDRYSIADVACFGYVHVADQGGFDLAGRPAIGAWIERVRAEPGFVPLAG